MDVYFNALIDLSQSEQPLIQVLTPPMSQAKRAERLFPGSCDRMTVVGGVNGQSGYDFMPQTYLAGQFAGYSWHNYWDIGHENWEIVAESIEHTCDVDATYQPQSHHVSQYFPFDMRNYLLLTLKPSFISEADVKSPCQNTSSPLVDKAMTLPAPYPVTTAPQSLQTFIGQEQPGRYTQQYVNAWLLVNKFSGGNSCRTADNQEDHNYEINWHEAYGEDGVERSWFATWWLGDE